MGEFAAFPAGILHEKSYRSPGRFGVLALLSVICLAAAGVHAQQPTDAQRNAVRSACRSDFMAQCSGVTPGGVEALNCLKQHETTLSSACRDAVSALGGTTKKKSSDAGSPAQSNTAAAPTSAPKQTAQPTAAQRDAVKSACRSDFMAQCSGVTPGGSEALACLQKHSATLSPSCQTAVGALGGSESPSATGTAKATGNAAATAAMPMASFTPREELMIVRRTCGPDFRAFCGSVPLGGGRGVHCLRDNFQRLSPTCQRVLTSGL